MSEEDYCEYSGLPSTSAYENRSPDQVMLGDKTALAEEATRQLYMQIEHLIIRWNNNGTQTAGSLTREIMKLITLNK